MPFNQELLQELIQRIRAQDHPLVTIDGRCASGKTTLAAWLAEALPAAVVHTDDYVIPHALKTAERLAVPGGNCDVERLMRETIIPWKNRRPVRMRRYDCKADRLLPEEALPDRDVLILEGSYCNLPPVRQEADLRIFLDISREEQRARLRQRETPEGMKRFDDLWIPLEEAYFTAYRLPDEECITLMSDSSCKQS